MRKEIEKQKIANEIAGGIYQSQVLQWMLLKSLEKNEERIRILYEIFRDGILAEPETAKDRIFQYGSLIRQEDLFARQIFLGLVQCLEAENRKKIDGRYTENY